MRAIDGVSFSVDRGEILGVVGESGCGKSVTSQSILRLYDEKYQEVKTYNPPKQIKGYEYEVEACIEALEKGELECPQMPHVETIRIMEQMDMLRKEWGYEIPTSR